MDLIDWTLAVQAAPVVLGIVQVLKAKNPFSKLDGEYLAILVGIFVIGYYALSGGTLYHDNAVDFIVVSQSASTGVVSGLLASNVFNLQDILPFKNLLPSRKDKQQESQEAPKE